MIFFDCGNTCTKIHTPEKCINIQNSDKKIEEKLSELNKSIGDVVAIVSANDKTIDYINSAIKNIKIITSSDLPQIGQYEGFGTDRLLAGIAAINLTKTTTTVIDSGTATTVDTWTYNDKKPFNSEFKGGMILAGLDGMISSLKSAPKLPKLSIPTDYNPTEFALDTENAVKSGALIGYKKMISGILSSPTLINNKKIFTGGNAKYHNDSTISDLVYQGAKILF